jgi:hypothetical protein
MEKPRLIRITSFHFNGQYTPSKKLVESFFKDYHHSNVSDMIDIIIGELYTSLTTYDEMRIRPELVSFLSDLHNFLMECYLGTKEAKKKSADSKTRSQS